jgi:hypothetical protein
VHHASPGEPILLAGLGRDRESGPIQPANFEWTSPDFDLLRYGVWLSLPEGLPAGFYRIRLGIRDGSTYGSSNIKYLIIGEGGHFAPLFLPALRR